MLNIIYIYFTKNTRQKIQNSNFKNLYIRIKNELKEREINNKNYINNSYNNNKIKSTPIEKIIIPDFLNDKYYKSNSIYNNQIINTNIKENYDEKYIREEFEKIKQQKVALLYEMYVISSSCNFRKEENEKYEYNLFSQFNINNSRHHNYNFDILPKLFPNSEYNSIDNDDEK